MKVLYQFLRLGFNGYQRIMQHTLKNAITLRELLVGSGHFTMMNDTQRIPVVAVTLDPKISGFNEFDVSNKVREKGWVLSAYSMPANAESVNSLRIVVRPHINHNLALLVGNDIIEACQYLAHHGVSARAPTLHNDTHGKKSHTKC